MTFSNRDKFVCRIFANIHAKLHWRLHSGSPRFIRERYTYFIAGVNCGRRLFSPPSFGGNLKIGATN
jgi:hypothetical protein